MDAPKLTLLAVRTVCACACVCVCVYAPQVAVPHEVLATTEGERWAMAGWFHEPSQRVPDWMGLG